MKQTCKQVGTHLECRLGAGSPRRSAYTSKQRLRSPTRAMFQELTILAVGLANTIAPDRVTPAQKVAIQLLERFLARVPPRLRKDLKHG